MRTKKRVMPILQAVLKRAKKRSPDLVKPLLDLLVQAEMEMREHKIMQRYPNFAPIPYSGLVGRAVMLLYCGKLFACNVERDLCVFNSGDNVLRAKELDLLVAAASELLSGNLSPIQDVLLLDILSRVCSTPYFLKEAVANASRVLITLNRLDQRRRGVLHDLNLKLTNIYNKAKFVHYNPWYRKNVEFIKSALMPLQAPELQEDILLLDPEKLIKCLRRSSALEELVSEMSGESLLPHVEAVLLCIEHAIMFLNAPHVRVFHPLHITYGDLSSDLSDDDLFRFMEHRADERVPSVVERLVRINVFRLLRKDHLFLGELHYLRAEDYNSPGYLIRCLSETLSSKQLRVVRSLQFPYRSEPENLAYSKASACGLTAKLCEDLMPLEPPEYDHVYETEGVSFSHAPPQFLDEPRGMLQHPGESVS